jgi:pimeloyl-ACP methyl ester carboxylesterase
MPTFATSLLDGLGMRMITPDRPGFGYSEFVPGRTIPDTARDVEIVADYLGLDTFYVLGVSAGAPYVLSCCIEFPDRIRGAGIVSGITPADEAGILHEAIPAALHVAARRSRRASFAMHHLLTVGMRQAPEKAMAGLSRTLSQADRDVLARPDASAYVLAISLEAARNGVTGWVYDDWLLNRPWGFSPASVPTRVPVKLWWGSEDQSAPVASGVKLAGQMPQATLTVIENCGHFGVMFEHIGTVLEELCD